MLPTDDETRSAILNALYDEKKYGQGGLQFEQLHGKLHIPWPLLWFNLDYLEEEKLILRLKKAEDKTCEVLKGSAMLSYEITQEGQKVLENKEVYCEKYPFLLVNTDGEEEGFGLL